MASGEPFYLDPTFWAGASSVVFVGIIVAKGGLKQVGAMLDAKSAEIAKQIEEARRLRDEAEVALSDMQRRQREAEEEAKAIVAQAEEDAAILTAAAKEDLVKLTERRQRLAEQKISQLEATAVKQVRAAATDAAIVAARSVIETGLDDGSKSALVDKSISDIESRLH